MKRLVQRVEDIGIGIQSFPDKLQKYLDEKSKDGWEYCGQLGMFYVFKRWEEEPRVVQGGGNPIYGSSYNNNYSNPSYRPYPYNPSPSFQPYQPQPQQSYGYNPSNFGVRVDPADDNKIYSQNPFED